MPTLSIFYGMIIQMYYNDHSPPHFHVQYGEYKATILIGELVLGEGSLPRRALNLVLDWAELHQDELMEDWCLCQAKQQPRPIKPLE